MARPWLPTAGQAHAKPVRPAQGYSFIVRVSVGSDGSEGDDDSGQPAISADGRYVVFTSDASNLAPGDNYFGKNVFVRDLIGHTTKQADVSNTGAAADDKAWDCDISADGRYVAFRSDAALLPGMGGGNAFVRDMAAGTTECVSITYQGQPANCCSYHVRISGSGRYVVFESTYDGLVEGDNNQITDVFRFDRTAHTIQRLNLAPDGSQGNGPCQSPAINGDGSVVVFESSATNLVPGGTDGQLEIYLFTGNPQGLERISRGIGGAESNDASDTAVVSQDGSCIAFTSRASNLVEGDTNNAPDVFVYDRSTGRIERVSVASDGSQGNSWSGGPAISADGRYVAFVSDATNLVPGDTNGFSDVFVHDRQTGKTIRVSMAYDGSQSNGWSFAPSISADGRYVAFASSANNLVADDKNGAFDVFVVDVKELGAGGKAGDFNGDGHVDATDLERFVSEFSRAMRGDEWDRAADLSGDGKLDHTDAALMVEAFINDAGSGK